MLAMTARMVTPTGRCMGYSSLHLCPRSHGGTLPTFNVPPAEQIARACQSACSSRSPARHTGGCLDVRGVGRWGAITRQASSASTHRVQPGGYPPPGACTPTTAHPVRFVRHALIPRQQETRHATSVLVAGWPVAQGGELDLLRQPIGG